MTLDIPVERMTAEEFDTWVFLPENIDRHFELIPGKVVDILSLPYASEIGALVTGHIGMYLMHNDIGFAIAANGGYAILDDRLMPSVAFMSHTCQPDISFEAYNSIPPDLAVEVISNPDDAADLEDMTNKITAYLAVGTIVWVANYKKKTITVHAPGKAAKVYGENDTLDGGEVLPGFTLLVKTVFP